VLLERAAWRLRGGTTVTGAAFEAGYESVEGFSRAFRRAYGHVPSQATSATTTTGHWLPAPNGIHFHPPTSLWVHTQEQSMDPLTDLMIRHDLDDTRDLIAQAKGLSEDDYRREVLPAHTVLTWDGAEGSIVAVLEHLVFSKEVWVAAIEGADMPPRQSDEAAALLDRHDAVAPRWLAAVRDIDQRGAWEDRLIDALCDPPESFVLSSVVAHVLTFAAHRRQLVRLCLRASGHAVDQGDPIEWLRARAGVA
ncbi:MAG: DinB family protein, partial [Nocardioides sp.]|nr:DinB family protein [Nocardioides sp.]